MAGDFAEFGQILTNPATIACQQASAKSSRLRREHGAEDFHRPRQVVHRDIERREQVDDIAASINSRRSGIESAQPSPA